VLAALGAALTAFAGFASDGAAPASAQTGTVLYRVTIENLTTGQPFSPADVLTHDPSISIYSVGSPASAGIQAIGERGDASVLAAAMHDAPGVTRLVTFGGPTLAGATSVGYVTGKPGDVLSLAMMLACTNDGFVGLSGVALPTSGSMTVEALGYDAGTEPNTELTEDLADGCGPLSGTNVPADGNAHTDEGGVVAMHPGISGDGDLAEDVYGWDEPSARITISVVPTTTWTVSIANLSDRQPLSPPVLATHEADFIAWRLGEEASEGVRTVAEQGSPATLVAELTGAAGVYSVAVFEGPLRPGEQGSATIMAPAGARLSVTAMIGCTNDGFAGIDARPIGAGSVTAGGYDAGTEPNSEKTEDLADGCGPLTGTDVPMDGNAHTDEGSVIRMHPGITGTGDLPVATYGWVDPIARITVSEGSVSVPSPTPTMQAPGAPNTGSGRAASDGGLPIALAAGVLLVAAASTLGLATTRRSRRSC